MTDINNYKFEEYQHGQTTGYGTSKIITSTVGDTQIIQDNTQIDPSTYFQGDNAILQASAGMGDINSGNVDYFNQNNTFQTNSDANQIYGETIKIGTENPETYGQTFQGTTTTTTTTTTNVIDGNNIFGDQNGFITNTTQDNQGTNIDLNSYFNNTNNDTNVIYGQEQIIPTTTTTTDINTYYNQPQEIQGTTTYGETQILPSTDNNVIYGTTQIGETVQNQYDFGQPSTNNEYTTYQTSGTTDLNNYNIDINNIQPGTTTTTTTTTTNTVYENHGATQYQTQNYDQTNFDNYTNNNNPITNTNVEKIENTYDINANPITQTQYITSYDTNQLPTTTTTNQQEVKITSEQTPVVETKYTPPQPEPQPQIQTNQNINTTNPSVQENNDNNQNKNVVTPPPNVPQQQIIQLDKPRYKFFGKLIDEDFRRGRPIYSEMVSPSTKLRIYNNNNNPYYRVKNIEIQNRIGLSRLTPSMSYDGNELKSTIHPSFNFRPINSYFGYSNMNPINSFNNNLVNNTNNTIGNLTNIGNNFNDKIDIGLNRVARAGSYDVNPQSINPLLNNVGLNQINVLPDNKVNNLKNFV
jgi:hypothetical protein